MFKLFWYQYILHGYWGVSRNKKIIFDTTEMRILLSLYTETFLVVKNMIFKILVEEKMASKIQRKL